MTSKAGIIIGAWITFFILWPSDLPAQVLFHLNFASDEVGKFPAGWSSRDEENKGSVYSIQAEDGHRFLHADARAMSVQMGYEKKWEVKDFPILRWRWRARIFPEGTDERKKSGNDNVLSVYVVFGGWPIPRAIKYVWSDTLSAGTVLDSPHSGKTKIIVVRSGREGKGKWVEEERDVLADYLRLWDESQTSPTARGILLLTDSDSTQTRASGDYEDISVLSKGSQ
jgi:hypothetical protein